MLSAVFYLIIAPAILAFFLGFSAHGLKTMTTSVEKDSSADGNLATAGSITDNAIAEQTNADAEMTTSATEG